MPENTVVPMPEQDENTGDLGFFDAYSDGKAGIDYEELPTHLIVSPLQYWLAE